MKQHSRVMFTLLLVLSAVSCVSSAQEQQTHGIAVANMDPSVKPGDDFYLYTNGAWMKRTEIPPDRAAVGVFDELSDRTDKQLETLIDEISKSNAPAGSGQRKIADLYNSYMDENRIDSRGLAPLKPHLDAIAAINDKRQLARVLGETLRADVDPLNNTNFHTPNLFGLWVASDFNDSDHYTAYLLQGGLQLPDREYYLASSEHMRDIREKYQAHVAAMLMLAGFSNPDERAQRIFELEHAIAEKHWNLEDDQDIHKANNPWKKSEFSTKAPGLDWDEYFAAAGLSARENFIVWQPSAFTGEAALVESMPLETWKDWLSYHMIEAYSDVLPKQFDDEHFAFFGETLLGTSQQLPRWQRAMGYVNAMLGDQMGKIYAERFFPPEAKARAQAMVTQITAAFRKRIDALTWMDPATKREAQEKLNTLYVGIGYPETWRDYSGYDVKPGEMFENRWNGRLFAYRREVKRLGTAADRHEWQMTPQTVNAVNLPLQDALNFPAAILQPPFFDAKAPDAVNYGAIGSVIGHEISHTFDSEGSAFDAKGAVRNWWKPSDLEHFNAATARLAAQYDQYQPFPDLHLNGKQTLAENIADVAGLAAAYDGYHASLRGKTEPAQDGFSADQQFFIAFGQAHQSKMREGALRQVVLTNEHSPGEYRADTVRNIDAWYPAFDVKSGEKLYLAPGNRVQIW